MIDWMMLMLNLRHDYKPICTIARDLNSSQQHFQRISTGSCAEPRFNTGLKLLDLHLQYCGIEKHRKLIK